MLTATPSLGQDVQMERGRTVNQLTASCRKVEKGVYLLKTSEAKATAVPGAVKQKLPQKNEVFCILHLQRCRLYNFFFVSATQLEN